MPYVKNLTFRIIPESSTRAIELENGSIDVAEYIASQDVERLDSNPNVGLARALTMNTQYLGINCSRDVFKDNVALRQAIAYAINAEAVWQIACNGVHEVAKGFCTPSLWGFEPDSGLIHYDLDKAKQLMAEAGYSDGGLTLDCVTGTMQQYMDSCEAIKNQLAQIGIDVQIRTMDSATMMALFASDNPDYDLYFQGSTASTGEIDSAMRKFHSETSPSINCGRFSNAEFDQLVNDAAATTDEAARLELYSKAQKLLSEQVPWVPIDHKELVTGVAGNLEGFHNDSSFECHMYKFCYFS